MAKATAPKTTNKSDISCSVIASTEAGEINKPVLRTKAVINHSLSMLTTFSLVLVATSVENWGILQGTVLRKRKRIHLFSAATSETFFRGMTLGDLNVETVLVEQEELFLHDSNIDELGHFNDEIVFAEQEEMFLHD